MQLWDFSMSGLSFTYSFNGASDWLSFLNAQTSTEPAGLKSAFPKHDPVFLGRIFAANNRFWMNALEANKAVLVNPGFDPTVGVLVPCEKVFMLKFWSRCYLRWIEKYHAYSVVGMVGHRGEKCGKVVPQRPPPPIPPKPPKDNRLVSSPVRAEELAAEKETPTKIMIKNEQGNVIVTTTIKNDGSIESSF